MTLDIRASICKLRENTRGGIKTRENSETPYRSAVPTRAQRGDIYTAPPERPIAADMFFAAREP